MGLSQFDEKLPYLTFGTIDDAADTDYVNVIQPNVGGNYRVDSIIATNNDTVDHVLEVRLAVWQGTTPTGKAHAGFTIPAGAGNGTVAAVSLLDPATSPWPSGIAFPLVYGMWFRVTVAMATGTTIEISVLGGEL